MATYKNTNNCLLFFTPKNFLDAIDTIFQFRFVQSSENKWVLEFKSVADFLWQRKPIFVSLNQLHEGSHRIITGSIARIGNRNAISDIDAVGILFDIHQFLKIHHPILNIRLNG